MLCKPHQNLVWILIISYSTISQYRWLALVQLNVDRTVQGCRFPLISSTCCLNVVSRRKEVKCEGKNLVTTKAILLLCRNPTCTGTYHCLPTLWERKVKQTRLRWACLVHVDSSPNRKLWVLLLLLRSKENWRSTVHNKMTRPFSCLFDRYTLELKDTAIHSYAC